MEFYEVVKKYETETKAMVLSNCYHNKLLYNCKYDSITEHTIQKYLSIISFNKLNCVE
jgi:hypothetical protein